MNNLVKLFEFQFLLNQFIKEDIDLIPWKFVCKSNYNYTHDIELYNYKLSFHSNILYNLNVIKIDTWNFYNNTNDEYINIVNSGNSIITYDLKEPIIYNDFDIRLFIFTSNLKHLSLYYEHPEVQSYHLSYFNNLEYLDIGMNSSIVSIYVKTLTTLFLRNNSKIHINDILFMKKLKYLQICEVCNTDSPLVQGIHRSDYYKLKTIKNVDCFMYIIDTGYYPIITGVSIIHYSLSAG